MNETKIEIQAPLRFLLKDVRRNISEGILLSGGLDTSVLALIQFKQSRVKV